MTVLAPDAYSITWKTENIPVLDKALRNPNSGERSEYLSLEAESEHKACHDKKWKKANEKWLLDAGKLRKQEMNKI